MIEKQRAAGITGARGELRNPEPNASACGRGLPVVALSAGLAQSSIQVRPIAYCSSVESRKALAPIRQHCERHILITCLRVFVDSYVAHILGLGSVPAFSQGERIVDRLPAVDAEGLPCQRIRQAIAPHANCTQDARSVDAELLVARRLGDQRVDGRTVHTVEGRFRFRHVGLPTDEHLESQGVERVTQIGCDAPADRARGIATRGAQRVAARVERAVLPTRHHRKPQLKPSVEAVPHARGLSAALPRCLRPWPERHRLHTHLLTVERHLLLKRFIAGPFDAHIVFPSVEHAFEGARPHLFAIDEDRALPVAGAHQRVRWFRQCCLRGRTRTEATIWWRPTVWPGAPPLAPFAA